MDEFFEAQSRITALAAANQPGLAGEEILARAEAFRVFLMAKADEPKNHVEHMKKIHEGLVSALGRVNRYDLAFQESQHWDNLRAQLGVA